MDKLIYESSEEDVEENGNYTEVPYNFCNNNITNYTSSEGSWWTIDLATTYRISFIEITPQLGSLCPEKATCGQLTL